MICSKDIGQTMSEICNEKYVDCQDINYSDEEDMRRVQKTEKIPTNLMMHSAYHNESTGNKSADARRVNGMNDGGFCENDHGGPLVYGNGVNSIVIGVISACLVKERSNKCYGPFLYTSVYKNRQFISCSIYKDVEPKCRRQFRSGVTHVEKVLSWKNHPDGTTTISATAVEKSNDTKVSRVAKGNDTDEGDGIADEGWEFENTTIVDTRRILYSTRVGVGKRPYMVYLQLTKESAKAHKYRGWLCGGVIVDAHYVLTSAACVEDADHFYIVSGTTKFVDSFDYKTNECVCKHRRRVVWKCIPKNYKFDFQDSIKWSSNDIAIVKVDKPFKLGVCEKGCEFPTDLICYNNVSRELEKPGTKGYIAGWGSGNNFREGVYRRQNVHIPQNAKCLQEAKVCVMDNEQCAKKWAQRFRNIITQYMICTKDVMKRLSEICDKKYANCTDVENRRNLEASSEVTGTKTFNVDLGRHLKDPDDYTARRSSMQGGFCENDHGGPLIVKYKGKERVIGVISACKIDPKSHSCHGPFLYTSVFKNRQFISCAIHKDVQDDCRRVFRTGITHEEWDVNWEGVEDEKDDDSDEEKATLRQNDKEKKKEKKTADSSSSSESDEAKAKKKEKKEEKKKEKSSSSDKKKSKHSKREGKEEKDTDKKSKEKSSGSKVKVLQKGELFYESSRDENVNEPEEE
ncbi:hypothetical protein ABMA27_009476 [Loxostege sticticalis]|uniref:Peptidase S1 domain-containing protein n=1 Tax=Loxostege sticticalis TaxID=481309 RepID=A0ABR3H828_LOXSC